MAFSVENTRNESFPIKINISCSLESNGSGYGLKADLNLAIWAY